MTKTLIRIGFGWFVSNALLSDPVPNFEPVLGSFRFPAFNESWSIHGGLVSVWIFRAP
jgi:hypothetical protein